MNSEKKIISIGGGKGGVGKSILSANMAASMALSGLKVILVDTDYGASNLHAMLGVTDPQWGFQDLLQNQKDNLDDFLLDTGIENLKFLSGAGDIPGSADLSSDDHFRIIQQIKKLPAHRIVLDLGPGTSFWILDYFNLGTPKVVLTLPEMPSIMNSFSFIKAALFRKIAATFTNIPELDTFLKISSTPQNFIAHDINQVREKILEHDKDALPQLEQLLSDYTPGLIVNRVRQKKDIHLGKHLELLVKEYLGIDLNYLGYMIESDDVRESVNELVPFLVKNPQSKPSENLQAILRSMLKTEIHLIKRDGAIFVSKQVKLSSGWEV